MTIRVGRTHWIHEKHNKAIKVVDKNLDQVWYITRPEFEQYRKNYERMDNIIVTERGRVKINNTGVANENLDLR